MVSQEGVSLRVNRVSGQSSQSDDSATAHLLTGSENLRRAIEGVDSLHAAASARSFGANAASALSAPYCQREFPEGCGVYHESVRAGFVKGLETVKCRDALAVPALAFSRGSASNSRVL